MTTKIYGSPHFTSTGRVPITLLEKNVEDFEIVDIDLFKREHLTAEFLKNQPFGQIPYTVDGNLTPFGEFFSARKEHLVFIMQCKLPPEYKQTFYMSVSKRRDRNASN